MKSLLSLLTILVAGLTLNAQYIPGVLKIYDESEIDSLTDNGVEIMRRRGDIILCLIPEGDNPGVVIPNSSPKDDETDAHRLSGKGNLKKVHDRHNLIGQKRGNLNFPALNKAVEFYDAWQIQEGKGFESPYTGKGIVVGLCDIGLDPLHPTFLDENGKSRIKRITQYLEQKGERLVLEGDAQYKEWKTDNVDKFHATHVAGILAGNGGDTSFKGIARDAEIVASLSGLTDFGLLMGVEDIIDYAKEVGKPAVINLSMGNYIGAHDGTSLFSQYLDLCSDDAIIVLSSGNEGRNPVSLTFPFEKENDDIMFRLGSREGSQRYMYGVTDIWNTSDKPLTVTLCIFDDQSHKVVYEYEPIAITGWDAITYEWNPESPLFDGLTLNGYLTITGGIDKENGRYNVGLIYEYESSRLIGTGWAQDMLCVKVSGPMGDEVEIFADATYTRLMGISGYPAPNSSLSISDLACGERVISVGMYGNRAEYPVTRYNDHGQFIGQEMVSTGCEPGSTIDYSSYGILRDGRVMPLTVAPGFPIVSACSSHYTGSYPEKRYTTGNKGIWVAESGTSMSSPYVAGYIATWLEALPSLTPEDVIDVIAATNRHDIQDPDDPRNLNGYFDPFFALRKLLGLSGITQVEKPENILLPEDIVDVFSVSGAKVYSGKAEGCNNLEKGLYIIHTPFGAFKHMLPGLFR